ncbi:hypothetical protein ANCCEY_15271, partial [Ancylostoma ceylanicum]
PMWWLLVLVPAALALNYRCQNNQVLVVQSFGNDTIRMHCQRLDMCGYQRLLCSENPSAIALFAPDESLPASRPDLMPLTGCGVV